MSYGTITPPARNRQDGTGPPQPQPAPTPTPAPGTLLYDSAIHSALHNGIRRTIKMEGNLAPNGRGTECRASGNPRINVNTDHTYSLICDAGHGRFYTYVKNYNVYMNLVCGWGNQAAGQDLSLKIRSRHNEGGATSFRFGGYGFSCDRRSWGAKIEPYHNVHTASIGGNLPFQLATGQFFNVEFSVKDEGNGVREITKINGRQLYSTIRQKLSGNPTLFNQNSYIWVRSNIDSGTGELRIKSLKLYAI